MLKGLKWKCLDDAFGIKVKFLMRMLCDGYVFSIASGWVMAIELFISTILYLNLWKSRDWWDDYNNHNNNNADYDSENLGRDEEVVSFSFHSLKMKLKCLF